MDHTSRTEYSILGRQDSREGIDDNMLYKMGSQRVNRLCYLCLQHKLLECVHISKKDVEKWKRI